MSRSNQQETVKEADTLTVSRMLKLDDTEKVIVEYIRNGDVYDYCIIKTKEVGPEEAKKEGWTCDCPDCDGSDGYIAEEKRSGKLTHEEYTATFS